MSFLARLINAWIILLIAGLAVNPAYPADLTLAWDPVSGAETYRLYQSTDGGGTWASVASVAAPTTQVRIVVSDDRLILLRISATDARGESMRWETGVFYHGGWQRTSPAGMGITSE